MASKNILIIHTAFLGDVSLAMPMYKWLAKHKDYNKVDIVVKKGLKSLLEPLSLFRNIYEVEKSNRNSYSKILSVLNKNTYEYLLSLHESPRTHYFVYKIKAKNKIGYKKWWNRFIFDQRVSRKLYLAEPLRAMQLLRPLSDSLSKKLDLYEKQYIEQKDGRSSLKPNFIIPNELSMAVELADPSEKKDFIVVAPGSVWATKKWPKESYLNLCETLTKEGHKIVILGSKQESPTCDYIKNHLPEVDNLCGKTDLNQAFQTILSAKLVISNDSGPMHLASMADTPCVAIFGPTTLDLGYRPWQNRAYVVQKDISCRPCGKHGHQKCPIGTHECMKSIVVKEVLSYVRKLI